MLDVHPPHKPVHGWRDFVTHLLTITVGLLIALGLEAAVEGVHHHELAVEARENIEHELARDEAHAKENIDKLQKTLDAVDANLVAMRLRRDGKSKSTTVHVNASWTDFESAAWLTARESGALSHMPLDEVQKYAGLYEHQDALNREAYATVREVMSSVAPLMVEDPLGDGMSPEDLRVAMQRSADARMLLNSLQQFVMGLGDEYVDAGVAKPPQALAASASKASSAASSAPASH